VISVNRRRAAAIFSLATTGVLLSLLAAPAAVAGGSAEAFSRTLERLVSSGGIVGAQVLIGQRNRILIERNLGRVSPAEPRSVDGEAMFCIGSTSKPLVSTIVLGLVSEGVLELDTPIDSVLPEFGNLRLAGSKKPVRAPTLRELLTHRGGIYSQTRKLTPEQLRLIRDFHLTLEESVSGIARQPLIAVPGERYAYSGAGYCVIGRVAEVATGKTFEQLLRERLARPLEMKRTTYFPSPSDANVATGSALGSGGKRADPATPHRLGSALKLTLIGGSIYSTARDLARFSRMIINHGRLGNVEVLPEPMWRQMTSRQQPGHRLPNGMVSDYALGWTRLCAAGDKRPTWLTHGGALAASRSRLLVNLKNGCYAVVLYSLGGNSAAARRQTDQAVARAITGLRDALQTLKPHAPEAAGRR